jgi:GntR family transcriptional regulator
MTLLPELDRDAPASLVAQIAGFYARAIEEGRMRGGERLPPIREVANACDVTRATVQEAYRQLAEMGLLPFRLEAVIPDGLHEFLVDAVRDDSTPTANGMETIATLRAILEEQARAAGVRQVG